MSGLTKRVKGRNEGDLMAMVTSGFGEVMSEMEVGSSGYDNYLIFENGTG